MVQLPLKTDFWRRQISVLEPIRFLVVINYLQFNLSSFINIWSYDYPWRVVEL